MRTSRHDEGMNKRKGVTLPEWVGEVGDSEVARLCGVSQRCAQSWRLRDRLPSPGHAVTIIRVSGGLVDWPGIYGEEVAGVVLD